MNIRQIRSSEDERVDTGGFEPPVVLSDLRSRLVRIEGVLEQLLEQRTIKEWYSTDEVSALVGKAPFTVREWCRLGRVNAVKRDCGRGNAMEWIISHEELNRIRNHGLLSATGYLHVK